MVYLTQFIWIDFFVSLIGFVFCNIGNQIWNIIELYNIYQYNVPLDKTIIHERLSTFFIVSVWVIPFATLLIGLISTVRVGIVVKKIESSSTGHPHSTRRYLEDMRYLFIFMFTMYVVMSIARTFLWSNVAMGLVIAGTTCITLMGYITLYGMMMPPMLQFNHLIHSEEREPV